MSTPIVVLIKDFAEAKQRLSPALDPAQRDDLARENARRALLAAKGASDTVIAVACGEDALALAREAGVEVIEDDCRGQNDAAGAGVAHARARGATDVLLLSSDLPLVSSQSISELLLRARGGPLVMAAAATGRGGTNALYLSPPDAVSLHFGDRSLEKFARAAAERGVPFLVHDSPQLALDLDDPLDLERLRNTHSAPQGQLQVMPLEGIPEVHPGDDLAGIIAGAIAGRGLALQPGDILVVAQKVVSKAEGRLRNLCEVTPSAYASGLAEGLGSDPRLVQVVLDESEQVLRTERVLIVKTRQGFVCANAGVDHSNVPGDDMVSLLPEDSDASAARLREGIAELAGTRPGVVISDSFGRAWRMGLANVALGIAGLPATIDYRGQRDDVGKELKATVLAVADELAAAAELVMGKTARVPVALVRGYHPESPEGRGQDLVRPPGLDLFQ